jgi:hypothetical protein
MKFGRMQTLARLQLCAWIVALVVLPRLVSAQEGSTRPADDAVGKAMQAPWDARENLNSLLANPSLFDDTRPAIVLTENEKGFTRQLVRVEWRTADPIDLWVMRPTGVEKPPVILYLYSYPSETNRFRDEGYGERVTQGGYAAVGFVSALTGQRYHGVPMKEWFVSDLPEVLVETTHDVQMILNYLSRRGDMDMNRVGIYGQGSGGTIAVLAAAADPRIKALDLLDPWGDWSDWMAQSLRVPNEERLRYVQAQFLKRVAPFDTVRWLPTLKSPAVRLDEVVTDGITPAVCQKRIESAARRASGQIVKYKNVEALLLASTNGRAFQWLKDQLHSPAQAQVAAK